MLVQNGAKEPPLIEEARRRGVGAVPMLRLEKARFMQNERIWFWVGVSPITNAPIPRPLWGKTKLHITCPDGTYQTYGGGWPADGIMDAGWEGGDGLRCPVPQTGVYHLAYEFAELKTETAQLIVDASAFSSG